MLSTAEVLGLCGLSDTALNEWIEKGIITPSVPGSAGRSKTHLFSTMQAVGLSVALKLKRNQGANLDYVGQIVEAFASVSEEWLAGKFADIKTHLAAIHQGKPILQAAQPYWTDVEAVYRSIAAKGFGKPGIVEQAKQRVSKVSKVSK